MIKLYTDGACSGNPGKGGWGVVGVYDDGHPSGTFFSWKLSGEHKHTTNNRMELTAIIEGLKYLRDRKDVLIYSDSKYVVDSLNKGWVDRWKKNGWYRTSKEKALNVDLWKELLGLGVKECKFVWVRGHGGDRWNELADKIARLRAGTFYK